MSAQIKDGGVVAVLAVLRRMHAQAQVCRSGGAGSGTQNFEDERAIAAVAELTRFVQDCADGRPEAEPSECRKRAIDLLARIGGAK